VPSITIFYLILMYVYMIKFFTEFSTFLIIILIIIIILNFIIINLHPIFIVILLVLYRIITCLTIFKWTQNFIYSIIIFLIIISGLLIIFLYFSSLISNEQINLNFKPLITINFILNLIFISSYYLIINLCEYPIHTNMDNLKINYLNINLFQNIAYIYSYPFNNLTLICIFYLLLTLFIIIKICSIKNSSLRKLK